MPLRQRFRKTSATMRRISTSRILRIATVSIFALILLAVAALHIEQFLFRHKAQTLIKAVRSLEAGKTVRGQVPQALQPWGKITKATGDCSKRCLSEILLDNFAYKHGEHMFRYQWLSRLCWLAGARPAVLLVRIQFVDGILDWGSVEVRTAVVTGKRPPEALASYGLLAEVAFISNRTFEPRFSVDNKLHSTYWVGRPGGCDGCMAIWVTFLPDASQSDIERLGHFDLSCLTRWISPCRVPSDIMPAAWQQYLDDQAQER